MLLVDIETEWNLKVNIYTDDRPMEISRYRNRVEFKALPIEKSC